MPVAVVPRLLVPVAAAGGNEPVEDFRQVALQPRLKLDGPHRGRAADVAEATDILERLGAMLPTLPTAPTSAGLEVD